MNGDLAIFLIGVATGSALSGFSFGWIYLGFVTAARQRGSNTSETE